MRTSISLSLSPLSPSSPTEEDVTSGEVKVEAKLDGIPVYSNTMALCDVAKQAGVQCPIKPFVGSNSTTVTLPNIGVRTERGVGVVSL